MVDSNRSCVDCAAPVTRTSPKVVRCDPCRELRKRALNREAVRKCHASHRDSRSAYGVEWRKRNPSYALEWSRRKAIEDPEWLAARRESAARYRQELLSRDPGYWTRWARENPESGRKATRARRARKLRAVSEPYTLAEIAERDGWKCQLCSTRVPKKLKYPDRRAATIDHIVPLSDGGSDLRVNVQLAHFGCNCSKSNRALAGGEQLRLIG